jgi:hypothetical protein
LGEISKGVSKTFYPLKKYNKRLFLFRYGNYSNYTVQYTSAGPFPGNYLGRELAVNNAANFIAKQPYIDPETLNLSSLSYIFSGKRAGLSSHVHTAANSSHRDQKHTRQPRTR